MNLWKSAVSLALLLAFTATPLRADFILENEDYSLQFDGRLRVGYIEVDEFEGSASSANDRFLVEKAWIGINGTCFKDFSYELLWELRGYTEDENRVEGKNLRIMYAPCKAVRFHAGQFKVPFGRKFLIGWPDRNSTQLPAAAGSFLPGRDIGAMVQLKAMGGKYEFRGGAFTGQGANHKRDDSAGKKLYAARLEANPLGTSAKTEGDMEISPRLRLLLGVGYASSDDREEASSLRTIVGKKEMVGFDVTLKYKGLFVNYENNRAKLTPETDPEFKAGGFLVQGSFYISSLNLEPRIMYDEFDPSDLLSKDRQKTVTYGVNFLPHGNRAKIILEYADHRKQKDGEEQGWKENELRLMVQLIVKP